MLAMCALSRPSAASCRPGDGDEAAVYTWFTPADRETGMGLRKVAMSVGAMNVAFCWFGGEGPLHLVYTWFTPADDVGGSGVRSVFTPVWHQFCTGLTPVLHQFCTSISSNVV